MTMNRTVIFAQRSIVLDVIGELMDSGVDQIALDGNVSVKGGWVINLCKDTEHDVLRRVKAIGADVYDVRFP